MARALAALVLAAACVAVSSHPIELTKENFEAETAGANSFVKFLAPWCGHCKRMKPDWDKLGEHFLDAASVVIGDADCTASGKELCQDQGVSGYPTIKYFDAEGEHKYQGGRDFDSLKKFVEDNLQAKCFVDNQEGCTEKEVKYIAKMQGKTAEDRTKQTDRLEKMKAKPMKPALKTWLHQRLNILKQF